MGSTAGMVDHLHASDTVAVEFPAIEFIRPGNLCPRMKRITLPKILRSLERMEHQVEIDPAVATRARLAVERMVTIGRKVTD